MLFPPARHLWLQIAWPFLLFAVAGSIGIAGWLQYRTEREDRAVFLVLAASNADFIRTARLPLTERTAGYLGQILNVPVFIGPSSGGLLPEPPLELQPHAAALERLPTELGLVPLGERYEAIAAPITETDRLVLVRPIESSWAFLEREETVWVLAVFWLFSVLLAWGITRGVVRPLRLLTQRLPQIEQDAEATLPGAERSDEIGQLARSYLATRLQLKEERARREQAERLALLGRMATGLAHEIHNPLSAIQMHAQLLELAPPAELVSAARESIPVMRDEARRIEGLVNQWMFLARPEPARVSRINLRDSISAAVRSYRALADHAHVEVKCDVPEAMTVSADSRRLSQVIANVLINAVQAMPRGGTLTIEGEESGGEARIRFRDTGPGFSPEALARHRELFFSEKEGGMGIGLSVSAEIMEAHGGELEIANSAGGGAEVTLRLPLSISAPHA